MTVALIFFRPTLHFGQTWRLVLLSLIRDGPTFEGNLIGHWIRAGIRLLGIVHNFHLHPRLIGRHEDKRHVRVIAERFVGTDGGDDFLGIVMQRPILDHLIEGVIRRKDFKADRMASASGVWNITGRVMLGILAWRRRASLAGSLAGGLA